MPEQRIMVASENYKELDEYLKDNKVMRVLLIHDSSLPFMRISKYFDTLEERTRVREVRFTDFGPNPLYESVVKGVDLFHREKCDSIIAIGGGSAIDVAKCVKLYSNMDASENYLNQEIVPNDVKLLAVPTTAGTGSEATRYAVIYYNGEKQSVSNYSCIPSTVLMDASVLKTLPIYQKKSTMMDALCHSIESFWSIHSTEESKEYSKEAIQFILRNKDLYLNNDEIGNANMLRAANMAGKAINITQTTAGHAMCYKLISLYGIAHGHAAALCVSKLWPYMVENIEKCIDPRGANYIATVYEEIADAMECKDVAHAIEIYQGIIEDLKLAVPSVKDEHEFEMLRTSVNPVRVKNNPIKLDEETIDYLYRQILNRV